MLPLPGSPSASWAIYRDRLMALSSGADVKVFVAFWLFGLINNVLYVVILTAAPDLVGPTVPKAVVLLATILPSLVTKLLTPVFLHLISYVPRVLALAVLSTSGMLLVALSPGYTDLEGKSAGAVASVVATKMTGVALASISSAAGEVTFLGLLHFYGSSGLAGWGSGTGAAGLVGAGAYSVATTGWGLSSKEALFASAFFPFVMLVAFFALLPKDRLRERQARGQWHSSASIAERESGVGLDEDDDPAHTSEESQLDQDAGRSDENEEQEALLTPSSNPKRPFRSRFTLPWGIQLNAEFQQLQSLFLPYMLPLLLVYFAEYTINLGILPTVLFPLSSSSSSTSTHPAENNHHLPYFHHHYRDFYPTYNTIYQTGVFLSRSSTPFLRLHNLYLPSLLQLLNLILLLATALAPGHVVPDDALGLWLVFALVFWEGLLGGAVYVNTFAEVRENVEPAEKREWSLGAVSISDSAGIAAAGFVSLAVETALCGWQVRRWGRDWCRRL